MRNPYCPLTRDEIFALNVPAGMKGLLLSWFCRDRNSGLVSVPEDTFRELVEAATIGIQAVSAKNNRAVKKGKKP